MTTAALIKENISLGLAYSFIGLVHYYGGTWQRAGRHGTGEGVESSTSCLQVAEATVSQTELSKGDLKAHSHSETLLPTRSHLLQ